MSGEDLLAPTRISEDQKPDFKIGERLGPITVDGQQATVNAVELLGDGPIEKIAVNRFDPSGSFHTRIILKSDSDDPYGVIGEAAMVITKINFGIDDHKPGFLKEQPELDLKPTDLVYKTTNPRDVIDLLEKTGQITPTQYAAAQEVMERLNVPLTSPAPSVAPETSVIYKP